MALSASVAHAKSFNIHWDQRTHLRLAQCFIAEADENPSDWTAIAYTLLNWLEVRQRRYPFLRFIDVINTTCSVHKLVASARSNRQQWIRQLGFPVATGSNPVFRRPDNFPRSSSWKRKQRYWHKALLHAQRWHQGKLRNPCRNAVIWGAPRDPNNKWHLPTDDPILKGRKVVRLACSDHLSNDYYRLMTKKERAEFDASS